MTFDLDDTLYDNNQHMPIAEACFLKDLHRLYPTTQSLDKNHWRHIRHTVLQQQPALCNDMGELRRQILRKVFEHSGFIGSQLEEAVASTFECFYFHRSNFSVEKNVHSLLDTLAERYPLAAITNGNVNLEQIGLAPYFKHVFKANLHAPMKPHNSMFMQCQSALDIDFNSILHVGDNLYNDIFGAISAGFQSAWYAHDRPMDLHQESMFLLPHVQINNLHELLEFK